MNKFLTTLTGLLALLRAVVSTAPEALKLIADIEALVAFARGGTGAPTEADWAALDARVAAALAQLNSDEPAA